MDSGIRFTVVLHQFTTATPAATAEPPLGATERRVYQALTRQGRTVSDLAEELGLSAPNIRKALRNLRGRRLILQLGGRGKVTTYQRTDS
ncbi:winged helix-turn-helix domain-containing protein [Frankia sp. AiPa1]|uniref:winged helix-turn-helix domain-containing protein n=1 Tax=Frankia sp. AiPa1 TaxID=573492 RepID=UPI00202B0FE3|nr:winged helix-turn-helix domain-containing protein [Frankia sp. AiPa1]MCL9758437.1 winged helix-turn-helix domain-containing protein [Frankia sp. AiPa1]